MPHIQAHNRKCRLYFILFVTVVHLFSFSLLESCGIDERKRTVSPELLEPTKHFLDRTANTGHDIIDFNKITSIEWCTMTGTTRGLCTVKKDRYKIRDTNAVIYSEETRTICISYAVKPFIHLYEYILYHELGHCVLNAEHSPDPKSLMYGEVHTDIDPEVMLENYLNTGD